ncbi:MAG: ion channel [Rikenellaceae bacterium]
MTSKKVENRLNVLILICSFLLVAMVSIEMLSEEFTFTTNEILLSQVVVCALFMTDFFFRMLRSDDKKRFFFQNITFFLVAIPYMAVVYIFNIEVSRDIAFLLRLVPIIRGGYSIVIIIRWINVKKIANLLFSYLSTLVTLIYFSSIIFYYYERAVNPLIKNYWNALWWSLMDVTTVGSNIIAVTWIGEVLSVALAAAGMMFFPIFTAFIITKFTALKTTEKQS